MCAHPMRVKFAAASFVEGAKQVAGVESGGAVWQVFSRQHFGRVYVVHSACKLLLECATCAVLRFAVRIVFA
jgi:hypothetical protein